MTIRRKSHVRIGFLSLRCETLESRLTLSAHPLGAVVPSGLAGSAVAGSRGGEAAHFANAETHHDGATTVADHGNGDGESNRSATAMMAEQGHEDGDSHHAAVTAMTGKHHEDGESEQNTATMMAEDEGEEENEDVRQITFTQKNLVSNDTTIIAARQQDANLVNPMGIAPAGEGKFWVAENGSGMAELITAGGQVLQTVTIPATLGSVGDPTGIVLNTSSSNFLLKNGQPAQVILATADGTIVAWGPSLGATAEIEVDNSANPAAGAGAVYRGLAMGQFNGGTFLFATNFRTGGIDVFDSSFQPATTLPGNFTDPGTTAFPPLPTGAVGYAPFGIQDIGGKLYVTFAAQDGAAHVVPGAGAGFVDVFNTDGTFVGRVATGGALNAPWGLALAPSHLGQLGGALLVGNSGDGTINAFNADPASAASLGPLTDSAGNPITIDGLWGLAFSSSHNSSGGGEHEGHGAKLFFTAGPNGGTAGLFGKLAGNHAEAAEMAMAMEMEAQMEKDVD